MHEVPMLPVRIDLQREGRIVDIQTVNAMADLLKNSWPYEQTPSYRRVLLACFKSLQTGHDTNRAREEFVRLARQELKLTVYD